ncbi:CDP-alcohol phosphatidyltransferase family protein [Altererythrobacter sp. SALINAS58]|uniref:CDP-alcohol phosphatidyltransferase family protein n=1 Tax=Alteripontixanthobacter muriae TaxID=2705546 RepID=UPI0015757ED5|nr:CDP-alcohol phosphatidyltransferase family protein [Alteripontixanthobacter muriae]NTZ43366.1 CDP-alcohol phosphatidyltransferase family protein [Alteripontixanthobacter muriae]
MAPVPKAPDAPIQRIQENLVARTERRILNRLCAILPRWITPDILTAIGMFGAFMVFAGYLSSNVDEDWLWLSIGGYVVHWFGDSLDGSLARFRKIERPRYGYFLDHSCDGFATMLVVVGIGLSSYVELTVALVALVGYLLMSIHAFLSVKVVGELRLSYLNAGPTELRLVLIGLTLAMLIAGPENPVVWHLNGFDLFVGGVGLLLIGLFVLQTATTARRLAKEEPARRHPD